MKQAKTDIVKSAYDTIGQQYDKERNLKRNLPHLQQLAQLLPRHATILDLGCGAGRPVDSFFSANGFSVMGLDFSKEMIRLATKNVPLANFLVKNILDLKKREYSVDAVVSFYTLFHISREQHEVVLDTISSFLQPGGKTLLTFGGEDKETMKDFHGILNFWSQYSTEMNLKLLKKTGFFVIQETIENIGGTTHGGLHQIILAEKI